jgi:NADH-quinone oxidoreductase subunit N
VDFQSLVTNLQSDTVSSLQLFKPELAICATIVVMLFVRVFNWGQKIDPVWIAIIGTFVAFWVALPEGGLSNLGDVGRHEIFSRMLVYDSLTVFFRLFLLFFALLFIILVRMTGLADREDGQDFYSLLLGATLGMCLMASANHLMTVFLAVEMASVPSYVLAGILKGRRRASEAALKYAVFGAGAAGVMLYGISLLAGLLGTAHLPTIATKLVAMDIPAMAAGEGGGTLMVLALSALMIMVGLAFKLSAVPFHFWCPDVFEGATAEVDAFLSVASKAGAMALLVRVALGVTVAPTVQPVAIERTVPMQSVPVQTVAFLQDGAPASAGGSTTATPEAAAADSTAAKTQSTEPIAPVRTFIVYLLAILAAVTCTFGNLAAYGQTNIKRLFAYSTIAHAGYMLMAVAAAVQLTSVGAASARDAVTALVFYLAMYLFMNLGAFAIVAFLRGAIGSEEIVDYAGLVRSVPAVAVALVVILVSLIGIPPMAGFVGKFAIFAALVDAGGPVMMSLLAIAGLNTVISLVYYLRVAATVAIDPEPETRGPITLGILPTAYVLVVSIPVLLFGIQPDRIVKIAEMATQQLFM